MIIVKSKSTDIRWLSEKIDEGKINPIVDKIYPFDKIKEAPSYVESKRAKGKVILTIKNDT